MTRQPCGPAHIWVPPGRRGTYLDEVGECAEELHWPLDPWGVTAVDALMSYGPRGDWHTLEAVLKMPRQTGKTKGVMLPIALTVSTVFDPMPRLWTAQLERTYEDTFELACSLIEGSEEFSRKVQRIRKGDGDKGIEFVNGSVLDFVVRSSKLGRGEGIPEQFHDEALYFKASFAGALLPTMAAQLNPRALFFSSGATAAADSDYLRDATERGRAGSDPDLVFVEYCAPGGWTEPGCAAERCDHALGTPGCALDDERLWFAAIPSLGIRTSLKFIRKMRRQLASAPVEFGREFLGWDEEPEASTRPPISVASWQALADPAGQIVGTPVLSLVVAPDRRSAAIGLAGWRGDGVVQVEVVRHGPGEGWVLPDLRKAHAAGMRTIGLDGKNPAWVLAPDLREIGFEVIELGAGDVVLGCGGLQKDVGMATIRHLGDGVLDRAFAVARKRPVGDGGGWAWSWSRSEGDITPVVAVTNARQVLVQRGTQAAYAIAEWGD